MLRFELLSILLIVAVGQASDLAEAAIKVEEYWERQSIRCPSANNEFIWLFPPHANNDNLVVYRNLAVQFRTLPLTPIDRLNGIELRISTAIAADSFRTKKMSGSWSEWQPYTASTDVVLTKQKGQWKFSHAAPHPFEVPSCAILNR